MNILLAISPILLVLLGMTVLKKPAMLVAPIVMVYTWFIAILFFDTDGAMVIGQTKSGIIEGLKIILLIFSAFVILKTMTKTGAIEKVKAVLADITYDRRAQLVIIAVMFAIFLEGAAGAGSPAAIAAPFLVGLGFHPVTAAACALLVDATPASWGGAGVTTIMGLSGVNEYMTSAQASAMVGRFHMFGVMMVPTLALLIAFGRKGFKGIWPFLIYASVVLCLLDFFISNFIGPELTSLGTGLLAILFSVAFLKVVKLKTPDEYIYRAPKEKSELLSKYSALQAFGPYLVLAILLPLVRYTLVANYWSTMTKYGYIVWVGVVIFISSYLGSLILRIPFSEYTKCVKSAAKSVLPAMITICTLVVVSNLMKSSGMIMLLAQAGADIAGSFYPPVAVAIGSLGAFITGTGLGSNIMFAPMHVEAALQLGLNPIVVCAGQNAGAALGNLICPNNVVAAAITVGLIGREGEVMKKVFPPFFAIIALYFILSMLYSLYLFPGFGM